MKRKSKSKTKGNAGVIRKGPQELRISPSSTYTPDLTAQTIKKMLTEDDQRDLAAYHKEGDKDKKLAMLLESTHHLKTLFGEGLLGQMSRKALCNDMSYNALCCVLPLRAELARELNVTTIAEKMLLEAGLVGYARFMSFQEAASRLCADVNSYSAPVLRGFYRMSLDGLKTFQDTVEILKMKDRPSVRILVNSEGQVNLANVQQVVNAKAGKEGPQQPGQVQMISEGKGEGDQG
jgi:hypothetical protein